MRIRHYASFVCGTLAAAALLGLPAANAFADTTTTAAATPVTCKDGTTSPHGGRGSCSGHGGIDKAATAAAAGGTASGGSTTSGASSSSGGTSSSGSSGSSSTSSGSATPAAPAPAAPSSTHPPATQTATPKASPTNQAAAPGGGPGMVWVNSASKVYHCPNDRCYGKTKAGEYMTEADAKAKGNRADHNKPCS
jgi:hypothetical protein